MKMTHKKAMANNKKTRPLSSSLLALVAAGFVAGCSQVPDAVNPVQWYDNSVEFFAGEEGAEDQAATANGAPRNTAATNKSSDAEFPLLSGINQQQERVVARQQATERANSGEARKYAPVIARQGDAVNALNAPPAPPPTATAQPAAPTTETKTASAALAPVVQPSAAVETARTPQTAGQTRQLPATGNAQQDNFQARFAERLAEIRTQASLGTTMPASSMPMISGSNSDTVVVSSTGVEAGYGTAAPALVEGIASVNNQLTYVENAMAAIGPGAVKVATIRFENGSSKLSSRDRQILANVMKLKKERGGRIHVVGHASSRTRNTDPVKHKMINFRVSAARADAIARELMRMGADRAQLQINAISDSAPQYLEIMPTGEAGNRRAEIYLES